MAALPLGRSRIRQGTKLNLSLGQAVWGLLHLLMPLWLMEATVFQTNSSTHQGSHKVGDINCLSTTPIIITRIRWWGLFYYQRPSHTLLI